MVRCRRYEGKCEGVTHDLTRDVTNACHSRATATLGSSRASQLEGARFPCLISPESLVQVHTACPSMPLRYLLPFGTLECVVLERPSLKFQIDAAELQRSSGAHAGVSLRLVALRMGVPAASSMLYPGNSTSALSQSTCVSGPS
jgi:hypothetical protein